MPAIIAALVLRVLLLVAIPEGFYGPDSSSYFDTPRKLWVEHSLRVTDKRRWLYPILLAFTPLIPPSPARVIPAFQHAFGILSIVGVGWIVGHLTFYRRFWVPLVTLWFATWPRIIWYEHEIVAESALLCAFILTAALAFPLNCLRGRKRLFWFLAGAVVIVAIKPHGRGLWLGAILSAWLITKESPRHWGGKCWAAIVAGILLIVTSGSSSQGNWLLLNSALPLVNTEGSKWHDYRQELKPLVDESRALGMEYAWAQKKYKKRLSSADPNAVSPVWAKLTQREKEFSKVCGTLAHEAILRHPFIFGIRLGLKCLIAMSFDVSNDRLKPELFWSDQLDIYNVFWQRNPDEMRLLYRMDADQLRQLAAERADRNNPIVPLAEWEAKNLAWLSDATRATTRLHYLIPKWPGMLLLIGFVACIFKRRAIATSVLWLPVALYLATVFAVGDRLQRYIHPVEWIGWVIIAVGLDALLQSRRKRSPVYSAGPDHGNA